jgi:8-oxo-dGTP diphosphatase
MNVSEDKAIHIAAAVIVDEQERVLLVRKRNTHYFMQPGGKIDSTEQPVEALIRELAEELQIQVPAGDTRYIGQFKDTAANEPGFSLVADIFHVRLPKVSIVPAAEIEEVIWYHPTNDHPRLLAPLTEQQIIPMITGLHKHTFPEP